MILTIGTILIGLFYFLNNKTSLQKPSINPFEEHANTIKLTLNWPIYAQERHWLSIMFTNANEQRDYDEKQKSFQEVISAALSINDYNIALMSALEMAIEDVPVHQKRVEMLDLIINKSIQTVATLSYAYLALKQYPTCSSKVKAKPKVIAAYTAFTQNKDMYTVINTNTPSKNTHIKPKIQDIIQNAIYFSAKNTK